MFGRQFTTELEIFLYLKYINIPKPLTLRVRKELRNDLWNFNTNPTH